MGIYLHRGSDGKHVMGLIYPRLWETDEGSCLLEDSPMRELCEGNVEGCFYWGRQRIC
jgi:hypothetical protein